MAKLTIGLTGGLASGKSTALAHFKRLGADTFSADQVVHRLIAQEGAAYSAILNHFSKDILDSAADIDRAKLRALIFNSAEDKRWLEHLLHPLVRSALLAQLALSTSEYAVVEIPLLAESNTPFEWIDRILVIDSSEEAQQLRAKSRSGLSNSESRRILDQQSTREKRNALAHDIIVNQGDLSGLERQVEALHHRYAALSRK